MAWTAPMGVCGKGQGVQVQLRVTVHLRLKRLTVIMLPWLTHLTLAPWAVSQDHAACASFTTYLTSEWGRFSFKWKLVAVLHDATASKQASHRLGGDSHWRHGSPVWWMGGGPWQHQWSGSLPVRTHWSLHSLSPVSGAAHLFSLLRGVNLHNLLANPTLYLWIDFAYDKCWMNTKYIEFDLFLYYIV